MSWKFWKKKKNSYYVLYDEYGYPIKEGNKPEPFLRKNWVIAALGILSTLVLIFFMGRLATQGGVMTTEKTQGSFHASLSEQQLEEEKTRNTEIENATPEERIRLELEAAFGGGSTAQFSEEQKTYVVSANNIMVWLGTKTDDFTETDEWEQFVEGIRLVSQVISDSLTPAYSIHVRTLLNDEYIVEAQNGHILFELSENHIPDDVRKLQDVSGD